MKDVKKSIYKNKYLLNILLSIMICFVLGFDSVVYATELDLELENTEEYSEQYKEWLSLSEEERNRIPTPDKYLQEFVPSSKLAVNFNTFSPVLKANVLPDTYDLRNVDGVNYVTAVKSQGNLGLCWAFSATSVLETSIMINQLGNYELDPVHVTHIRYKSFSDYSNPISVGRELNAGGNFEDALHYWTSGQGPVLETSFSGNGKEPLTAKETLIDTVDVQLDAAYQLPSLDLNNSTSADLDEFINLIKKTIMQYGAIDFGGASPQPLSGNLSNGYKCGNPYNYSYDSVYTDNVNDYFCSPHAMTIIGWDDNFSKDNFKAGLTSGKKPTRDGAWIVKNSWGTRNGDEGYYYYSYEDYNLNRNSLWVVSEVSKREYDRIYSYDLISLSTSNINKNVDTYAVVFDKTNNTEILDEVSFKIVGNGDSIRYDIYVNSEDGNIDSDSFQLVKSASDAFDYNGYYTVKLNNPIELTGEQFVVKIKLKNAYLIMSESGKGYPGQNYLLTANGWEDVFETSDVKTLQLKTFTKNKQSNSEIQANTFVKYTANKYGDINLRTVTNNIPKASTLDYVIKDISGNDITNKFSIEKGIVVNDTAITSISAIAAIPSGNYQIDTLYNGVILDSTVFKMSEILKISDLQYEPFNNGEIGTITLKAYNVADNKYNLIIENSAGKEVTGLFSINQSSIVDNTVTITIMNSVITPADEYTVCVEDLKHNLNHERTFIINSKDSDAKKISLSEVFSTPDIFYEGNTGTFLLSANLENIDDDYVKISIYDKNNEVITNKFVVTGSEFTNNEILVDVKNNQVNIQIGVSKQSEVAVGIYRVDVSDVNNEAFAETYFSIRKAGTNIQITNFAMTSELIYSNEIASGAFNISTQGIADDHLKLFIKNDKQEMVTDLFSINSSGTSSTVVNNVASVMLQNDKTANISFTSKQSLPAGKYTILVTDDNSQIIDLVSFTIEQYIYVEGIVFNKQGDVFRPMGYKLIEPIVVPFNANNQNVSFYSSNKSVASVTKSGKVGIVDAWSRGTAIIIAESEEGNFTADYLVTVIEPTITVGETVLQSNYNNKLYEGYGGKVITDITSQDVSDGKILGITITDEQDNDVTENFEISGATVLENAAKIEISVLPNVKMGTYQVTVSESRLVSEQYSFVVEAPTLVSEIKVKDEELEVGEEKQLEVEILPDNALNKALKYETSDAGVATVDETGRITAVGRGTATITITSEDGNASAECEVIVMNPNVYISISNFTTYPSILYPNVIMRASFDVASYGITNNYLQLSIQNEQGELITNKFVASNFELEEIPIEDNVGNFELLVDGTEHITIESKEELPEGIYTVWVKDMNSDVLAKQEFIINEYIYISQLNLNNSDITLKEGEQKQLEIEILPDNATNKNLKYKSNDETIATVDETGRITAVGRGTATITVTSEDGNARVECYVTVLKPTISISSFTTYPTTLYSGNIMNVSFDVSTEEIINNYLQLSIQSEQGELITNKFIVTGSEFEDIPVVDNVANFELSYDKKTHIIIGSEGKISKGTYTIFVKDIFSNAFASHEFTVNEYIYVSQINLSKSNITLKEGEQELLEVEILPDNALNKKLKYETSDENIVSVDENGKVTAIGRGTATITVISEDGEKTDSCEVTVIEPSITIGEVKTESNYNDILYAGYGGEVTIPIITQDIKDNEELTVNYYKDGILQSGKTETITVTTNKATKKIEVVPEMGIGKYKVEISYGEIVKTAEFEVKAPILVSEIKVNNEELQIGEEKQLEVEILPDNALNKKLKYETSDENIVSVDETGKVTAIGRGTATITVTSEDGNASAECEVTVTYIDIGTTLKDTSSYKITINGENKYIENIVLPHNNSGIQSLTREEFISQFESFNAEIYEKDRITKVESNEAIMKTGMIVRNNNEEYYVIIKGDATGDGKINSSDALRIRRHIVGIGILEDVFIRAGDIDKSGLTSADALKIRRYIVGLGTIY